jgi:hypothetical protein
MKDKEKLTLVTNDDGSQAMVGEWENEAGNKVPDEETPSATEAKKRLRIGIVGSNSIAKATHIAYDTKNVDRYLIDGIEELDSLIDWRPTIVFVCNDIPLLKNDTLDDADFLNTVNKLVRGSGAGVCIRTTINTETVERLIQALSWDIVNAKIIYNPVFEDTDNIGKILTPEMEYLGGDEKAIAMHVNLLKHTTYFSAQQMSVGTIFDVVYAKLAVVGFKAVKQTFFNQLHDAIIDCGGANPSIVRRMIEKSPDLVDRSVMVPTFVRSRVSEEVSYKQARSYSGEFENADVKMFVGMTDKLPLLDECINYKNLKG